MAKCKVQVHLEIGPVSAVDAKGVAVVVVSGGAAAMRTGPSGHPTPPNRYNLQWRGTEYRVKVVELA